MRLTFRGSPSVDGPRAVNLNIYEGRRQLGFGGFAPTSTSSAFVVVGPRMYCPSRHPPHGVPVLAT